MKVDVIINKCSNTLSGCHIPCFGENNCNK